MRNRVFIGVFLSLLISSSCFALPSQPELKSRMDAVYGSFQQLYPMLVDKKSFESQEQEQKLLKLITQLRDDFEDVSEEKARLRQEPGFSTTLHVMNEMLDDALNRFREGRKSYAHWRLRSSMTYCITCHTRYEVPLDFSAGETRLGSLSAFERGDFYLATRQFEKAKQEFIQAAWKPDYLAQRLEALRKWLIVYTRVDPDPTAAIQELMKIRGKGELTNFEDEEIQGWLQSLRRWKNESKLDGISQFRRAQNLIRQGLGMHGDLSGVQGEVELLRATALLHKGIEGQSDISDQERRESLYMLGLAYSKLQGYFVNELPEMFLEQCIREYPNTSEAKKSYKLYDQLIALGFTGSGGTRIPDDVKLTLEELHDLAYGVKGFSGSV